MWLAAPASAATGVALEEGRSALAPCLSEAPCGERAHRLLGESMAEVGLTLQSDPIATSALAGKGRGPVFEIRVDSATLGSKNALEERLPTVPALPRISGGWQLGSASWDAAKPQLAAGATLLPSVPVAGGMLSSVQLDASIAVPLGSPALWLGLEASRGASLIQLPMVGTEDQLDGIEQAVGTTVERRDTCEAGCLDAFRQGVTTARIGVSVDPVPALFAYSRVALAAVNSRLEVEYDETTWSFRGTQVQSQSAVGVRAGNYQIAAGAVVANRPPDLSTRSERTIVKWVASTSWRLGPQRVRSRTAGPDARL